MTAETFRQSCYTFIMKKHICIILGLLITTTVFAQEKSAYQMARFNQALDSIETLLKSDQDAEKVVRNMIDSSDGRIAAFNLQALAKIYAKQNDLFGTLRKDFKTIEDGIGTADKWIKLKNKEKEKKAVSDFAVVLRKEEWSVAGTSPKMQKIRNDLQNYAWPTPAQDRQFILGQLGLDLEKIKATAYDFSKLEEGNGLHEFRREVRWFTIKARVLNGLFKFKAGNACPVEELKPLLSLPIATSKYAQLPANPSEKNTCAITQCLFVDMASIVESVGAIKDEVEQLIGNTGSDETPEKLRKKVEAIYDSFKSRDTLTRLGVDLKSCQP